MEVPSSGPAHPEFPSTQWSVVRQAFQSDVQVAREAMAELCRQYWYPIYAHIRRRTTQASEAEDLTQAFFTQLLERESLQATDPAQGRLRAFLIACCNHFLANQRAHERALKRGGGKTRIPFDVTIADRRYQLEPVDEMTPQRRFDRQWALCLLDAALRDVADWTAQEPDRELARRLVPQLTGGTGGGGYAAIAAELRISESSVKKAAQRLRQRFGECLRRRIAATVGSPAEVEDEIRDLFAALD